MIYSFNQYMYMDSASFTTSFKDIVMTCLGFIDLCQVNGEIPFPIRFGCPQFTLTAFKNFDQDQVMFSGIGGCHYTVSVLFLEDDSSKPAKPMIPTTITDLPDAQMSFCIMLDFSICQTQYQHFIILLSFDIIIISLDMNLL